MAGGVIILFRWFIDLGISFWHSGHGSADFETASWQLRLFLPTIGGFVVGAVLYKVGRELRQMGVTHVLERMMYHQGYLSWKNAAVQFFIGGLTLGTGQSVGREGPAIHLGSAASSWLGQKMKLPNNSIRVLVGCGTAAAISASYNTPLAGVIFAMEVVMMEYTVASFIPLILSSVSAAILAQLVFGDQIAFVVPPMGFKSLSEIPVFMLLGVAGGVVAGSFILTTSYIRGRAANMPIWLRTGIAGSFVGLIGLGIPEILGIGYDTVNQALHGELTLLVLTLALIGKFLATAVCAGMSMPGGGVGPSMFIGAMLGGTIGAAAMQLFPGATSHYAFYAMVGMATMMSAILQAPLAALMALLELTNNPNILLPGMIAVVLGNLMVSQVFKQPSLFLAPLRERGLDTKMHPLAQYLRSIGVAGVMERKIAVVDRYIKFNSVEAILNDSPRWILINDDGAFVAYMPATDLARYLVELQDAEEAAKRKAIDNEQEFTSTLPEVIDLLKIPAERENLASIYLQANLEEALDTMDREKVDAVYIYRITSNGSEKIYGILTREQVESHYGYKPSKSNQRN